jgi:hypothetical protein
VAVRVDQAGDDRPAVEIDHPRALRRLHLVRRADGGNATAVDDQHGILQGSVPRAVDQRGAFQDDSFGKDGLRDQDRDRDGKHLPHTRLHGLNLRDL